MNYDNNKIVSSYDEFEEAISDFQLYKPIKVEKELKNDFHNAISKHFINIGVDYWQATMTPLKKSWKFKRK